MDGQSTIAGLTGSGCCGDGSRDELPGRGRSFWDWGRYGGSLAADGTRNGRAIAGKPGGDQRSSKTDTHADLIMAMLDEDRDITLAEIQSGLAGQGVHVGIGTLWRFFDRRGITRKKAHGPPRLQGGF